jgi:hypothetical protein
MAARAAICGGIGGARASYRALRQCPIDSQTFLLITTLAQALLREDAGFHAYQMLEAGVRQFTAWGDTDEGRHILIAVARYLAAHSPTERAALQTANIARRLMVELVEQLRSCTLRFGEMLFRWATATSSGVEDAAPGSD